MDVKSVLSRRTGAVCLIAVLSWTLAGTTAWGLDPKQSQSDLGGKEFFKPELYISTSNEPLAAVLSELPNRHEWQSFQGAAATADMPVYIDPRSGTASSILGAFPLIPGRGVGNDVTLESLGASVGRSLSRVDQGAVLAAAKQLIRQHSGVLGIDAGQLGSGRAGEVTDELWHVSIPQSYNGIPVRWGRMVLTVNNGNVVVFGTESWGNVEGLSTQPGIAADKALQAGFTYAGGRLPIDVLLSQPALEIIPFAPPQHQVGEGFGGPIGQGFGHRLAWVFAFNRPPELETWEVQVDAHSGEVLAFQDTNHYDNNEIVGGVYPVTSTEICPTNGTCGTMQGGWPMPFADTGLGAPNNFTNSAGLVGGSGGSLTTTLSGQFVNINDTCGGINNGGTDSIDLGGSNGQHDCQTGGGSSGNTPASRTAFYELNKLIEMATGWLPNNTWIDNQLTANVNINQTCNANYSSFSGQINFYASGGGCRNTGELAGVFDHEWGHALDDNDSGGGFSNSSEGYADIVNLYRLHDSCVGHGFFETINDGCGQTADGTGFNTNENQTGGSHCDLDCSGVRDADWDRHADHNPDTPLNFVCGSCLNSSGPCGRQVHCSAAPVRQAAWDLVARDLPAAGFDANSSFIIGNKVFYQGSGNVGTWYSCTCTSSQGGCGSGGGYLQWLAADDDDGNLNNGTPHMTAIFDAYNRHGIACATPTPVDSGCGGGPTTAPTLSVSSGQNSASLSWNGVGGASEYWVFRTEGHAGCDFGKALIAEVGGTSFTDTEVAGGREYYYNVVAAGSSSACFTAASNCANVTPTMPGAGAPDVTITAPANGSSFAEGDPINFTGTAIDVQDGDISGSISWSSSINGALGGGASIIVSSLSVGTHTITASATDSDTLTGTDQISVTVQPGCTTVVYSADFESGDGGWTTGPGETCTTGTFILGVPDATAWQVGGGNPGSAWFTQNNPGGIGTDDVDGGTCETLSPVINVGSDVSVFVDYYHGQRDPGDDAGDGFSIDLIDASTSAVVLNMVSFGDVLNNATWTSIADATGSAPSQVRLRVRATDAAGAGDIVEGGIDNIQVCSGGCTVDADCDNGLFCDGSETCNVGTGTCQAGTAPDCTDGVSCTGDSCNEGTDSCDNTPNDGLCSNGLFCDGTETCNATLGCQAGAAPDCNDGVGCTADSCNEGTDACDNVPNNAVCDDGEFCNGAETCDPALDCQAGSDPCSGGACDEDADICLECTVDADCNDNLFCNGVETCNGAGACEPGTAPCAAGETCDENGDICVPGGTCLHDVDFESGAGGWIDNTNGPNGPADPCSTGFFLVGTPDATAWQLGSGNPGQAFYTQPNPGGIGTDDTDNGTCEALSPSVNAAGQVAVEVSLDYYHGQRDNADGAGDGLVIEVLNNGSVAGTLASIGDVTTNPAWTSASVIVNNPGNIQVRARVTDDTGSGDIVEAGIDNVQVCPAVPSVCSVEEGFEAGGLPAGWFNDGASTCTTGDYVQGNPANAGGGQQIVGSHGGTGSLFTAVNVSAGNADVDGGNCILGSPSWGVANASTLSVWYWHGQRDNADDPNGGLPSGDGFALEYSTDGGANWNTMASNGDSTQGAAWTEATAAIPAGSNVQLRVQCSDGSSAGDLVECGIDDVSICE